jgi:anti-anti-sigma regulatory factor
MQMTVDYTDGSLPIAVLAIHGELDASNFQDLIDKGKELYQAGTRSLLLDLSDMPFMSSSGVVAFHSLILLLRGQAPHDTQSGWEAFHAIDRERGSGAQTYVKLINPQPKITLTLQKTGLDEFFEVYGDLSAALASL